MPTASKTFPGVYSSIIDRSAQPLVVSRFQAGLVGVAAKGPFNTPTRVRSVRAFQQAFGKPVVTSFTGQNPDGRGYYLADAVAVVSALSDGITVVRVGSQYAPVTGAAASGSGTTLTTDQAKALRDNDYLRVREAGKPSTVNVQIVSRTDTSVTLRTALAASYVSASVDSSPQDGAANEAESVLYGYAYTELTTIGAVQGNKSEFSFTFVNGPAADLATAVGDVFRIVEGGKVTTSEVRVKRVVNAVPNVIVELETSNDTQVGYQALPLQDSYVNARLFRADTGSPSPVQAWSLRALTAGTWANGKDSKVGLYVGVRPGSKAGTKRLEVYENGALVEVFDNLSDEDSTKADSYEKRINGVSQYFTIASRSALTHAANTANPWSAIHRVAALSASPKSMPFGAINHGSPGGLHGSFDLGFNGLSATDADFIGRVNEDGSLTGIKAFEDSDNITVDILAAPMDEISPAVAQELGRVARAVNAVALVDIPSGLNAQQAVDWHNGAGAYVNRGRLDTANVAFYWNWFQVADRFSSTADPLKWVPPTIGALRCLASTFDTSKPWFAAAGETRGLIPEALQVEFPRVSDDAKAAMYGDGNSVNPILLNRGRIMLFGERTAQRAETKLTALHSVILVNTVVKGLSAIARRYVFDPNDKTLLSNLKSECRGYLSKVENDRGIEGYSLVMDETNNTADTRNRREVRIDLALVPVDSVERIFLNATVRESGAVLNQATA